MPDYLNISGRSGVASYEVDEASITITWRSGRTDTYTAADVGDDLAVLHELAESGLGLNSHLNGVLAHPGSWGKSKKLGRPKIKRKNGEWGRP